MKLVANIDGASFGNPGPSGLGVLVQDSGGKVLKEYFEHLGYGTNNRAEYLALLRSVELAEKLGADELEVKSDSQLVVSQMNGVYKIKHPDLKILVKDIFEKIRVSRLKFSIVHIPREYNKIADKLAKKGAGLVKE
ncbi:MAG: ribonuclease HI family protein [Candidatus Kryptoniota bacterium]